MWQDPYDITWAEDDGVLYIKGGGNRATFMLPPFAGPDGQFVDGLEKSKLWFKENKIPFLLRGVNPIMKERMTQLCPECYVFEADRDNFEYIYRTEDLINLSGKKYRQKKNHLNQFRMQYLGYEYEPISAENMQGCRDMAAKWAEENAEEDGVQDELRAINLLFDAWDVLKLKGGVIKVFGHVEAFSIGEFLNDRMALIHIEKANNSIRGLYQAINNEFLKNTFADVEFVNREEDMGIPGLRHAKESYNPVRFAEKYTARSTRPCDCITTCGEV